MSGTLLGADGRPMKLAHVSLYPMSLRGGPLQIVRAQLDGGYVLEVDTTGSFTHPGVHTTAASRIAPHLSNTATG